MSAGRVDRKSTCLRRCSSRSSEMRALMIVDSSLRLHFSGLTHCLHLSASVSTTTTTIKISHFSSLVAREQAIS